MASYYLSPIGNSPRTSTTGAPLSGGFIYTYLPGTTTPLATYTDNTGGTPQANPIVLNTYGLPTSPIWLLGGQAVKFVIKDSLGNTISPTYDNVSGINDLSAVPAAVVVNRAYAEYTANADLTVVIPYDDTIPQITEGTQILSVSITPKSVTNRLRLRLQGFGSVAVSSDVIGAAFFVNGAANAVAAGVGSAAVGVGAVTSIELEFEYVPGSTSAQSITVRVGGASGTMRLNGSTAARRLGGVARTTLVVEEIAP